MYNGRTIIIGLLIFVGLVAFPIFNNKDKSSAMPEPSLDTPVIKNLGQNKCVESKDYMRANHMQMLNEWRDSVLRDGNLIYENSDGKEFIMSLQNTCMNCHSNKAEFCDRCHTYAHVKPYCWSCHLEPKENRT